MAKKPALKLRVKRDGTKVSLQITAQSVRTTGSSVQNTLPVFRASNKFVLESCYQPEISGPSKLYLRGEGTSEDDSIVTETFSTEAAAEKFIAQLKVAVAEFNANPPALPVAAKPAPTKTKWEVVQ